MVLICCGLTCGGFRAKWECKAGGNEGYEGDEETRQELLRKAYELGADYIDVELKVCLPSL